MSSFISATPSAFKFSRLRCFTMMIMQLRLVLIAGFVGALTVFQTVSAFAADPTPKPNTGGYVPPNWCPLPTYKSSASAATGLNSAVQEMGGWVVLAAFCLIPVIALGILFASRDTEKGARIWRRLNNVIKALAVLLFGAAALIIVFTLVTVILKAIYPGC